MSPDRGSRHEWQAGPLRIRVTTSGTGSASSPAKPKERLSVDRIVDTALEQMRTDGYEAVSMRSIAKALGTGPASLYAHVANRDELDQLVVDRIAQQLTIPVPDPQRWQEQLVAMMTEALRLFREHPGAARASLAIIPTGLGTLRTAEGIIALCRAGGVPDQAAAWFCDRVALYVAAVAVEESIWAQRAKALGLPGGVPDHEALDRQFEAYYAALPASEFPLLRIVSKEMTAGDGDDRFDFGLRLMVAGIAAQAGGPAHHAADHAADQDADHAADQGGVEPEAGAE